MPSTVALTAPQGHMRARPRGHIRVVHMRDDVAVSDASFVPFGLTEEEAEVRRVLVDGVPAWMKPSLLEWLRRRCTDDKGYVQVARLRQAESACMLNILPATVRFMQSDELLSVLNARSDLELLRLTDYFLSTLSTYSPGTANELRRVLDQSSSRWMVGDRDGRLGLVERVPAGVQQAAEEIVSSAGAAGRLLASAWTKVHRFEPDDSGAYADAVKAVEVASFKALNITKPQATLGDTIRAIRNDKELGLPFSREDEQTPTNLVLKGMLQMLWVGHHDRHGSFTHRPVSHDEADAAVAAAVALVQWFASGCVQRRARDEVAE